MKLKLAKPDICDKWLEITQEDGPLCIRVDYDDVDHDEVLRAAKELVRIVNRNSDKQP